MTAGRAADVELLARALYAEYREAHPGGLTWETDSRVKYMRLQAERLLPHMKSLLAAEREKALLAVQSYSEAELAAERERGRVDGLREAHRQILGLLGAPAPEGLAEPAPGEGASRG